MKLVHGSLFSGIGGFDLASQWRGWTNAFNCEINPFCRQVLQYHFKDSISYEDIRQTDFTEWRGKIDVLTGGFPCQPFSVAGLRKGKDDDRYLWPEMLRVIREIFLYKGKFCIKINESAITLEHILYSIGEIRFDIIGNRYDNPELLDIQE